MAQRRAAAPARAQPARQPARRAGDQADAEADLLRVLRHVVRSFGRGAGADHQDRGPGAGEGQDLRGRSEDGLAGWRSCCSPGRSFRTVVDNAQTNDPDNPTITVLNGNRAGRRHGASSHRSSHAADGKFLRLHLSRRTNDRLRDCGRRRQGDAEHRAQSRSICGPSTSCQEAGRSAAAATGLSQRFADSAETAYVPGYVVWNAHGVVRGEPRASRCSSMATICSTSSTIDGLYYTSAAENHVIPGAGRSVMLTLHWKM